ncbi:uncharacterized protein LOC103712526 [Phoenix dactylifera]|uniref:Uncharacterized protein LOC103712526 n=2 Tax=Magnoliopsida TaxID=3398 RepID=A0A8B9AUC3_PHODC|nr:uncharacterized protein LOC103712526 [Phoenix dactylifera]
MGYTKDQLLARLRELQIDFICYDHPAVLTVEAQAKHVAHLGGALSKNLLLKDKKNRFYVVSALAGTNIDMKVLSQRLGLGKGGLRMAPEEALQEILQVPMGCVTPFALINDSASAVSLLLDQGFKAQKCCYFHPLTNETTISLSASDLNKFLTSIGRQPTYVDLEASPLVGKDNPPDLASLVPSGVPTLTGDTIKAVPAQMMCPRRNQQIVQDCQIGYQHNQLFLELFLFSLLLSAPPPSCPHPPPEKSSPAKLSLGQANSRPDLPKNAVEKTQNRVDALAEASDVGKFVNEIIDKISTAFLSEVSKNSNVQQMELRGRSVLDGIRKRVVSDLENMTMSMKNAAYTQGFHAGFQSMLQSGIQNQSFRN